jgi:enamine deaminase RidA (YjgF/YER057c/UK114 family)
MKKQLISSGAPWEAAVGYSRAVRVGDHIFVSGTTAVDESGAVVGAGDPYQQAAFILKKIELALTEAGGKITDVVRTRMYVTDIAHWEAIGKAHGEFFSEVRPAATMVEVSRLIGQEMLVEIEVDALLTT